MKNIQQKTYKGDKGFTLTEIVVVMVLLGLIIILATSITLIVNHSQLLSQLDSKDEGELLKLRTAFDDWLLLCDSESNELIVEEHELQVKSDYPSERIYFKFVNEQLVYSENVGYEPQSAEIVIKFKSIKDVTFNVTEGNIICCTARFETTDYKMIGHLRAATILNQE